MAGERVRAGGPRSVHARARGGTAGGGAARGGPGEPGRATGGTVLAHPSAQSGVDRVVAAARETRGVGPYLMRTMHRNTRVLK